MGVAGEVVVVDNGSTDGSPEIAAAAGARVVHERRRGYGSAYLRGFAEARGRYLVMGDADDTYDFVDIARFVAPLQAGGCDLVMGTRLKGNDPPRRHALVAPLDRQPDPLRHAAAALPAPASPTPTAACAPSPARRTSGCACSTTGMEFASEMVVNALRDELRIDEIPITYHPRIGESKLSGLRDAWRHVRFMLLFSPSYLFQLPGLLADARVGGVADARCSPAGRARSSAAPGTTTRCSSAPRR